MFLRIKTEKIKGDIKEQRVYTCRCSGRNPSVLLVFLVLTRPSISNLQHSPVLLGTSIKGSLRAALEDNSSVCLSQAGPCTSANSLCRQSVPATLAESTGTEPRLRNAHGSAWPCRGAGLPQTALPWHTAPFLGL